MHELSLAQAICETVARYRTETQRVVAIVVECGPLSGVVPESLEYCFGIVAGEAGLGDARFELRCLSARAVCPECKEEMDVVSMWDRCSKCDHCPVTVRGGRELVVKQIEVEDV